MWVCEVNFFDSTHRFGEKGQKLGRMTLKFGKKSRFLANSGQTGWNFNFYHKTKKFFQSILHKIQVLKIIYFRYVTPKNGFENLHFTKNLPKFAVFDP